MVIQLLSRFGQSPLAIGGSYGRAVSAGIPDRLFPGSYSLIVVADAAEQLGESGPPANNVAVSAHFEISQPERPNLVVESVSGPLSARLTMLPSPAILITNRLRLDLSVSN